MKKVKREGAKSELKTELGEVNQLIIRPLCNFSLLCSWW